MSFKRKSIVKPMPILDRSKVLNQKTSFSITEEYKAIRTNITFSIPGDGCKVIALTSAETLEGKSINCLNLAVTFSETGARVLLIDCDLRLPAIFRLLAMSNTPGISNVLVGVTPLDDAIQKTEYKGLDVILSGKIPPNPSELLGSKKMQEVLEMLKTRYDYILIDTPPVNVVSDALELSKLLSGVILVVRSGISKKEPVKRAIERLRFVDANILGFILNAVPNTKSGCYESYYSYAGYDGNPPHSK